MSTIILLSCIAGIALGMITPISSKALLKLDAIWYDSQVDKICRQHDKKVTKLLKRNDKLA